MGGDKTVKFARISGLIYERKLYHLHVAEVVECAVGIVDIRYASTHTGCKVAASAPKYYSDTSGHVFAAVIAYAFHYCQGSGVPDTESLSYPTIDVDFSRRGAIQRIGHAVFSICIGRRRKQADKAKGIAELKRHISFGFTRLMRFLSQK